MDSVETLVPSVSWKGKFFSSSIKRMTRIPRLPFESKVGWIIAVAIRGQQLLLSCIGVSPCRPFFVFRRQSPQRNPKSHHPYYALRRSKKMLLSIKLVWRVSSARQLTERSSRKACCWCVLNAMLLHSEKRKILRSKHLPRNKDPPCRISLKQRFPIHSKTRDCCSDWMPYCPYFHCLDDFSW